MSTLIAIADAVLASLAAGAFLLPVTDLRRVYQPKFELSELDILRVSVVPRSVTITNAARVGSYFDAAVDVGIQKKVNPDELAELDQMMQLVEEFADHLRQKRLDAAPEAAFVSIENDPAFAPEHLDQQRVFTSVLTVTYRVLR